MRTPTQSLVEHVARLNKRTGGRASPASGPLDRWVLPVKLPKPINPALVEEAEQRAEHAQNKIADRITAFSGSMAFVYIHIIWFGCWIGFGVEKYPFGLLTMIVSLEAIFLSTFVMISQNRADARRQALADRRVAPSAGGGSPEQAPDRPHRPILGLTRDVRALAQAGCLLH